MKVGFIGLGNMGGSQAQLLASSDHELAVFDVYGPARDAFAGRARIAQSPADAAREAEIVCVCVRDDAQVLSTIEGPDGIAAAMPSGGLIQIHSTIQITTIKNLAQALAPRGIDVSDAPVSRTRMTVDQPFVVTMLGGNPNYLERSRPILETFSTETIYVGELGSALALKICNNLVTWTGLMVGAQAARISQHFGVPLESLLAVMKANGNLTPPVRSILEARLSPAPAMTEAHRAFQASQAGIGEKDLALAIDCGVSVGCNMDMARGAQALVRRTFVGN
jgi:3-hydroxyisobutyrate dehydrogenase